MSDTSPKDVVIVEAVRTASGRGRPDGSLADLHPVDLLAQTIRSLLDRQPAIDPATVDDVIIGCVSQVGEQSGTPGRLAWLAAGYPCHVPAVTIDRKCGSSQQALHFAAHGIKAGEYDVVVVGGVESMSRVTMGSARMGADPYGMGVAQRFAPGLVSQGVAAELVAKRWNLTRSDLDTYAARSQTLAAATADQGRFRREIVPIQTPSGIFDADETIRRGTTPARLAGLPTVFDSEKSRKRFPEVEWAATAGNSSQITDAASALILMSRRHCDELGLTARGRIHTLTTVGDDPLLMLTGPIPATRKVLTRSGLSLDVIEHVELNEAFASVPLAWLAEFDADPTRLNPRGGAIALGHALGASGARLMTTMLHALEDNDQQFGLQLMCEAGGMANATIIERL